MNEEEYRSVVDLMHLPNGLIFGLPVVLDTGGWRGGRAGAAGGRARQGRRPRLGCALLLLGKQEGLAEGLEAARDAAASAPTGNERCMCVRMSSWLHGPGLHADREDVAVGDRVLLTYKGEVRCRCALCTLCWVCRALARERC